MKDIRAKSFVSVFLLLSFCSCHQTTTKNSTPSHDLSKVKVGMSFTEVLEFAGFPDEKVDVGTVTDEFGHETKTQEWHYGDNQLVVIVNDTVNAIDLDVKSTYQKIQHIMDSAKAAGDSSITIRPVN
jgi:hypothetical protein